MKTKKPRSRGHTVHEVLESIERLERLGLIGKGYEATPLEKATKKIYKFCPPNGERSKNGDKDTD